MMLQKHRQMTVEKAREYFSYDGSTGVLTWRIDRRRVKSGSRAGSIDSKGHRRIGCEGRTYAATSIIWLIVFGRWPSGQIDHKNVVPDDDRFANLREATGSQNCMNRAPIGRSTKGVSLYSGKFHARITVNRKTKYLGSFDTEESAICAYTDAAKDLHGDFRYMGGAR